MMRICNQLIAGLLTVCITLACPVQGTSQGAQSSSPPAPGGRSMASRDHHPRGNSANLPAATG